MLGKSLVLFALLLTTPIPPAHGQDSGSLPSKKALRSAKLANEFNRKIFYRNKLEFSYEVGWLPWNIPLIFDVFLSSPYTTWPLKYTMVPNIASLRWQVDGIHGPSV
ncbi:MAG: hypothetical protein RB191_14500, partial [Terriglobia bacterium]|nr:hypothetical protein [Terriglobia bacterium]